MNRVKGRDGPLRRLFQLINLFLHLSFQCYSWGSFQRLPRCVVDALEGVLAAHTQASQTCSQ